MKHKSFGMLHHAITVFAVFYFSNLNLPLRACIATNCWQFANHQTVAVNQITNIVDQPTEAQSPPKEKVWGAVIFFVIILMAFAYIISQLIRLMDKIIPPPDPPPEPHGPTNGAPITFNPTGSPGPCLSSLSKNLLDTNMPSWGTMGYYHISQFSYVDKWAKTPSTFFYFWSTGMRTSTNLADWEDSHYRIDAYVSASGTFFAYYHVNTNFYNAYFSETTNARAYFDLSDKPYQPQQYFRLDPK
jgi:hypothetical protein